LIVRQIINIDARDMRARDQMLKKYVATIVREKPRFAQSRVAVDDADDEPLLSIEGLGITFNTVILNKKGETIVFEPGAFDKYIAGSARPNFQLNHDPTKVFGSNIELCLLNVGIAFRLPLTNKHYAATIVEMVQSRKQACISIGFTELKTRNEVLSGHLVKFIEEAEIREISLCPRGACKRAFARLINANNEPPLNESVNTDMFGIEYGLHNIEILKEDNHFAISSLVERLSALKAAMPCHEPQTIQPSMTAFESNRHTTDRYEELAASARRRLRRC
jgi:HK97 family phage prohead protease